MKKNLKIIGLVVAGNVLDYYDFMLFAHLGAAITGYFIPNLNPTQAHLMSLLLFSLPFVIRPIGGYLFGSLSDRFGRGFALGQTLKYASLAGFGIALLPGYEMAGVVSMVIFILLRALQGLSLGGEYMTAGTFLMEKYQTNRGLLSAIIGASGSCGSLIAFAFAWFYLNDHLSPEAWRIAFALGALATYVSFFFREKLKKEMNVSTTVKSKHESIAPRFAILITLMVGILTGVSMWIPMVYVNFYFTKILHYPASMGLMGTFTALLYSIFLTPIAGYVADRVGRYKEMMLIGALLTIPLGILGTWCILQGSLWGTFFIMFHIIIFGAPLHAVVNPLFPAEIRGRYVSTLFMLGGSVGSLVPVMSAYLAEHHHFYYAPMIFLVTVGALTSIVFYRFTKLYATPKVHVMD